MTIRFSNAAKLDWVDDTITQYLVGMDWSQVSALGDFVIMIDTSELPVIETLTPPIPSTSLEWRIVKMDTNFIQLELEVVDVPPGVLPGDASNYTDAVFMIPYGRINLVGFRVTNSVLGNAQWIE